MNKIVFIRKSACYKEQNLILNGGFFMAENTNILTFYKSGI